MCPSGNMSGAFTSGGVRAATHEMEKNPLGKDEMNAVLDMAWQPAMHLLEKIIETPAKVQVRNHEETKMVQRREAKGFRRIWRQQDSVDWNHMVSQRLTKGRKNSMAL